MGLPSKTITGFTGSCLGGVRGDRTWGEAVAEGIHGANGALSPKCSELGGLGVPKGVWGNKEAGVAVTAGAHGGLSRKDGELGF